MSLLQGLRRLASARVTAEFGTSTAQRQRVLAGRSDGDLKGGTCDRAFERPSEGGDGKWLLENSVTPGVKDSYRRHVLTFLLFAQALGLGMSSVMHIDRAFCSYFDEVWA